MSKGVKDYSNFFVIVVLHTEANKRDLYKNYLLFYLNFLFQLKDVQNVCGCRDSPNISVFYLMIPLTLSILHIYYINIYI